MKTLKSLAELPQCDSGEQVVFTAYISNVREFFTTEGKPYSRVYFRDRNTTVNVPLWNIPIDTACNIYAIDTVVCVLATTKSYNGGIVIDKITSATEVTDPDIVAEYTKFLFRTATESNKDLVDKNIKVLTDTKYGPYVAAFYGTGRGSEQFSRIEQAFASINHHDNYPGGLLNHVGGMLRIATDIKHTYLQGRCEKKWAVDWEYIAAAILLHDIGKLETYDRVTKYVVEFKKDYMLDHNTGGVGMLYAVHYGLPAEHRLSDKELQELAYTIRYHDDIDKLYAHKRMEDKLVSCIDGLEANLAVSLELELGEEK